MCARSIDDLLANTRSTLHRVGPRDASAAMRRGGVLVDLRGDDQQRRDGVGPDAVRQAAVEA